MADSLTAPAHEGPVAYHKSGTRPSSEILWITIHDTEGGTAESISNYFHSPQSGGSAHLVCDDEQTVRCLPDNVIPWAAPPANTNGLHIELCGFAKWKAVDWHHHEAELHRAAFQVAEWCKNYDIPPTHIGVAGLKAHQKGIVTHQDVTWAWHQSTHTNPGPGFPMSYFIDLVRFYLKPPPPVPHFTVSYVDKEGTQHTQNKYLAELEDFFRLVAETHTGLPDPYPVIVTYYSDGVPPA